MALRQIRIGSLPDIGQYDDADYAKSMEVEDPISCTAAPVDVNDVVRLDDLGSYITGPASSADSNLVEFNGLTGKVVKDGGLSHADISDAVSKKHSNNLDHVQGTDTTLGALGTKNPPIDADLVIQRDSVNADVLVTSTWTQIKAFLKTYFDTLYLSLTGFYRYAAAIADDGTTALPAITVNYAAKVEVIVSAVGIIDANATFMIDSTGTVTPQIDSGNVVYNIDTDTKLCIGTAAAQNPLTIKNRLGDAKNILIDMRYN